MAGSFDRRRSIQPNQTSHDAAACPNPYDDGLAAQGTAYSDRRQDLLGFSVPMNFSYPSSTPRSVPSQHGFPDHNLNLALYSSSNVDDQGQQDDPSITLTTTNSIDLPFSLGSTVQSSDPGIDPGFQLPRYRKGQQANTPWTPVQAAGLPTPTKPRRQNSRMQAHLRSQNQDLGRYTTPSQPDSGYYTLSRQGRQDAQVYETETTGTAETLDEWFTHGLEIDSSHSPSIAGFLPPGANEINAQGQANSMDRGTGRRLQTPQVQTHEQLLRCTHSGCGKEFSTPSQLTKHYSRHTLAFKCTVPGCKRTKGFSTSNDLDRHRKTVHKMFNLGRNYKCFGTGCKHGTKTWPRLDNFKNHLEKLHPDEGLDELVQRSDQWYDSHIMQDVQSHGNIINLNRHSFLTAASSTRVQPSGSSAATGSFPNGFAQPMSTVSPHDLDNRYEDRDYLIPGTREHNRALETLQNTGMTGTSMTRTMNSMATPSAVSGRASVSGGPYNIAVNRIPQQTLHQHQYSVQGRLDSQARNSDTGANDHPAPQVLQPGNRRNLLIFPAQIPVDNVSASLAAWTGCKSGLNKAKTAPNPDTTGAKQLLREVDSTMPPPEHYTPGADSASLLAVGSALHLGTDRLGESPSDGMLGSHAHSPAMNLEPADDQIQSILRSALSQFPGVGDSHNRYSQAMLEEVVRTALRSVDGNPRGPSSSVAMTPSNKVDANEGRKTTQADGKIIYRCSKTFCNKTTNRQSEMNKHELRHRKPYGCTFDGCDKLFGSKNDFKRHEHSQHEQPERWRCEEYIDGVDFCYKLFPRRDQYLDHLQKVHTVSEAEIKEPLKKQRISKMHQTNYWCGFCRRILTMEHRGIPGDNERFDHIVNHFIKEGLKIDNWYPPEGHKTKGEIKSDKQQGKARNGSGSNDGHEPPDEDADANGEDDDDEMDEDSGSNDTSPPSSEGNSPPSITQQPPSPQPQHPQQMQLEQNLLLTPPPTNRKRKATSGAGSNDGVSVTSPSNQVTSDRHVRPKKRAECAICCRCRAGNSIMLPEVQLLAVHKRCVDCGHDFCKAGCEYKYSRHDGHRAHEE